MSIFKPDLFAGQHALVTGGTSGIGKATAIAFAAHGARVTAAGLHPERAGFAEGLSIDAVTLDVRNDDAIGDMVAGFDRLDILVNSAGVSRNRDEYDAVGFRDVIAINLTASAVASLAARPLLARQGGAIVNMASMLASFGSADRPAYSASKGGIVQLTKSLAQDFIGDGIRVNAIAPGWIDTPLAENLDQPTKAAVLRRIPTARFGDAEEVADAVLFLSSPAAAYITGAVLAVDGGYLTV